LNLVKDALQPQFESAFLNEIAAAFEARSKAIRYRGELVLSREMEESGERLNVDFDGLRGFRTRLSIWTDGVFWLGNTKPGPKREGGWAFKDELAGNLAAGNVTEVVARFEQTISGPAAAREYWKEWIVE
jgi:hypothetical protein